MKKEEKKYCYECGQELGTHYMEYEGEFYCEDCFYDNYIYCDECGNIEHRDNVMYLENYEICVCESCLQAGFTQCNDCENYIRDDEIYLAHDCYNDDIHVCEDCLNNYHYCEGCGGYYHECCVHFMDYDTYCDDCYEEHRDDIYEYHDFDDWELFKSEKEEKAPYYIGKEIELEPIKRGSKNEMVQAIYGNINAVAMKDSSLAYDGIEVVTHPESWEYLQEHKENYKRFFEEVEKCGYGNNGGAGLHFHISKPSDDVISRIIVILESFKEEIKKLSRRQNNSLSHWAKFLSDGCGDTKEKMKYQSVKYLKEKYVKGYHDRYYALNLCNSNTIEFRFFNGANNFEEFWAALEFIHNVMEVALNEEKEINTITWKELLIGDELINQASKQGVLNVDKKAKDTTDIMEKYEKAVEKAKKEIVRVLGNLAKYINKEMSQLDLKKIKENNVENIQCKCSDFIRDFQYRMQYLERIINLYNYLNNNNEFTINQIKDYWENTKNSYPVNSKRYKRYDNQIKKAFKTLESEEI